MEQDKNAALYPDNANDKRNHKFRKQLLDESILPSVMYNDCISMVNWMSVLEIGEFLLWDQVDLVLDFAGKNKKEMNKVFREIESMWKKFFSWNQY